MTSAPETPLLLRWQADAEDFKDAYQARNQARRARRNALILGGLASAVAGAGVGASILIGLAAGLFAVAVFIVFLAQSRIGAAWPYQHLVDAEVQAELGADGVTIRTQQTDEVSTREVVERYRWAAVHRALETDRVFVVLLRQVACRSSCWPTPIRSTPCA